MKKAVAILIPYMEEEKQRSGNGQAQGKVLVATVKGDVHDIGKNIVGVVLACNNYEVVDLGVMVPVDKILATAREINADIIGLSGLITPSLDEMVHVAREMQREGFTVPLLIGGATTSRTHTAVKIAPAYQGPVVHVLDASKAVGVVGSLRSDTQRSRYLSEVRQQQASDREKYLSRQSDVALLDIAKARENKARLNWENPAKPAFIGVQTLDNIPLDDIVPYIDWSPFFHAWELRGIYPRILEDPVVGRRAQDLLADGRRLLKEITGAKSLRARAVYGLWPANSLGDDIEVYRSEARSDVLAILHTLRQQTKKATGEPNYALADFVAPKSSGAADYIGAFVVSSGEGLEAICARFEKDHDDYNSIMSKVLADRLAEAMAEYVHKRVRGEWGYGAKESLSVDDLIQERYRGIRPAPGYPASPDHTEKQTLFQLLNAEENSGVRLTENFAMTPASSVCGLYISHPDAKYFSVGKINKDQVLDYQIRKGISLSELERWLSPNLAYEP
jgi:5-methyltetrahydrofolate--homocysteine methyltransferase